MYPSNWGLRETPFRSQADPQSFYQGPVHEEALARLQFLVEQHRRVGLLLGEQGCGKSLVLDVFADQIRRAGLAVAQVNLLGLEPEELLWELAVQSGISPQRSSSRVALWRMLSDRLLEHRYEQRQTVVLLDDADRAATSLASHLMRLAQLGQAPGARVTIVLAARPGGVEQLPRGLLELAELRIDLEAWEPADTEGYLSRSLERAGGRAAIFAPPAVARLHELTGGVPRRVSQLADLALLAGAGRNLPQIDAEVIESVYHELGVVAG